MATQRDQEVTRLLADWGRGDSAAADRLLPMVYEELRVLAHIVFEGQSPDHTLQPTALVHEAYLRLAGQSRPDWTDRKHFFRVAARAMRQILADAARRRRAAKRGGGWVTVALSSATAKEATSEVDLVALDEALEKFAALDGRKAQIVELRYLAGLSIPETADVLGVSRRTVALDWRMARAWLRQELGSEL